MKTSESMIKTLEMLEQVDGRTTNFGYLRYQPYNLHSSTVKALIARAFLEQDGEMDWSGHPVPLYRISVKGKEILATAVTNK